MRHLTHRDWMLFALLVSLGAGLRLVFRDIPNFAPIAAISLFAGYRFRHLGVGAAVPLFALLLSDLVIGGYSWQMMLLVYGMLILPALCGPPLRRAFAENRGEAPWRPAACLMGCSLAGSLLFFAATNFGSWLWFDGYTKDLTGLLHCYAAAIPFFRYTLSGDIIFACVLFGSHAVAVQVSLRRSHQPATAVNVE